MSKVLDLDIVAKAHRHKPGRLGPAGEGAERAAAAFAKVFSALGESTRLRIMQILPRQPVCEQMDNVLELADQLGLSQPTVSHHLKILSEAHLVLCRRQCNSLYYYVNQAAVLAWLEQTKCRFGCQNQP